MDLDSTVALLSSNLPVGGDPNSAKKKKALETGLYVAPKNAENPSICVSNKKKKNLG